MFQTEQHVGKNLASCRGSGVVSESEDEREPLIVDWDELDRRRWAAAY